MFFSLLFSKLLILFFDILKETTALTHQDNATYWKELESEAQDYNHSEFVSITTPSFAAIRYSKSYIDKTGFLKELLSFHQSFLYLTAPAKFGKSINLDMLRRYLDAQTDEQGNIVETPKTSNYELFVNTTLFMEDKPFFDRHNQQYKVISLNFQHLVNVRNFESFKTNFCTVIYEMMRDHWYLQKKGSNFTWFQHTRSEASCLAYCLEGFTKGYVSTAGKSLSAELYETYKKPVVVLGDQYSAILHTFLKHDVAEAQMIWDFLASFVSNLVKDNPNVHRAFFAGSLTLGGVTSSLADSVIHYNFIDRAAFGRYFGFTQREVDSLLVRLQRTDAREVLRQWFDGYTPKDEPKTVLYNPLPIFSFLASGEITDCWVHMGDYTYLRSFLSRPEIGREVQRILMGDSGNYPFSKQTNTFSQVLRLREYISGGKNDVAPVFVTLFIQYLTESGFFTYDRNALTNSNRLVTPNFEISEYMDRWVYTTDYLKNALKISLDVMVNFGKAINALSESEASAQNLAKSIHAMFVNKCPLQDERIDFLGALYGALKSFHVDVPVGGFTDVSINPLKDGSVKPGQFYKWGLVNMLVITTSMTGIVFETRLRSSPDVALKEMVDDRYFEVFAQHQLRHKVLLAVNLDDSCNCEISYLYDSANLKDSKKVAYSTVKK